jgi:predicted RecB family nuclease
MPSAPEVAPGKQCHDPIECEFLVHCNPPLPDDHVLRIPRLHASAAEELAELGIDSIRHIPDDFELTETQRHACDAVRTGEPWFGPDLATELGKLEYPLCFMDFESLNPALPRFAGMHPYQPFCFQFSVHKQREPKAELEHVEFIAKDASDPRRAFIELLIAVLGERGTIVVYNAGFECLRLSELAECLPKYAKQIKRIQKRIWDLLPVVRNHVYHPAFGGSFSLKAVLPALGPTMSYDGMEVADGQAAGIAWNALVDGKLSEVKRESTREALLEYCGKDTMAMVRLLSALYVLSERLFRPRNGEIMLQ